MYGSGNSSSTLSGFQRENDVAMRMRALTRVNPYMGQRPDALYALASSPLSNSDLMDHGAAMFGLQASDSMRSLLEGMSPAAQRATWQSLTPAQQQSLNQQGFKPAERDEDSIVGMIGRPIGAVGSAVLNVVTNTADFLQVDQALNALVWLGDQPAHLYRTIRTMDENAQWAALAGAAIGVGALVFAPMTGGASLLAGAGTLSSIGMIGGSALIGASAAAAATNPGDWYTAWVDSANGERTFERAARRRAEDILGDPRLLNLAHDIAWAMPVDYSISDLAAEMAGNRDVSIDSQVSRLEEVAAKFAVRGTPEFQQLMTGMVQLIQAPQFQEAVQTLQNGKISIGRDVADGIGLSPGTGWYNLVSGATDGVLLFALDPLLIAGRVNQYRTFLRRGMDVLQGEAAVDRFMHIYNSEQGVQKMHKAIAAAVESGEYDQMRVLSSTMKEQWSNLLSHRDELIRTGQLEGRAYSVADFHNYMTDMMRLKPLMEGYGTVRGMNNGVVLASIGRHNEAWRAVAGRVRAMTNGLTDVKFERNLLEQLAEGGDEAMRAFLPETVFPDVARAAAAGEINNLSRTVRAEVEAFNALDPKRLAAFEDEAAAQGVSVMEVFAPGHTERAAEISRLQKATSVSDMWHASDITPELLQQFALRNEQYPWSRMLGRGLGHVPAAASVGELFTKMTTMVPAGKAIALAGPDAPESIRALTELAGMTAMPQWLRKEWANMMLWQPTVGMRMTAIQSFVDAMLTSAGIRSLPEGEALADRYLKRIFQSYAAGGLDSMTIGGRTSKQAIYLDEMADAIPMPDLTELRQAVKGGIIAKAIGFADLPVLEQFQTKVWKPSVLLRFGFIPRAAGEEFLNYMLRGGFGSLVQELSARSIARQKRFDDLVRWGKNGYVIESAADRALLLEGPMPAGTRWVSRMLSRYDWTDPISHGLDRYATFYRSMLEEGIGQGDNAGKLLTKIAGTDMPLYQLANNVSDYNAARSALSTPMRARLNVAYAADSLLFGNPLSWRRMWTGGVNDDVIEAAYEFFGHNGTSVMRAVGASNAGPYDVGSSRQDHIRIRIEDDINGAPRYQDYTTVRGERELRLMGDPYFHNAAQHQATRVIEDELMRTVYAPHVSRVKPQHITTQQMSDVLEAYHARRSFKAQDIITEFLDETPDWNRWQAMLARMQHSDPELAAHLDKTITRSNLSFERVQASVVDAATSTNMNLGWEEIADDLMQWDETHQLLRAMPTEDQAFFAGFLSYSRPEDRRLLREAMQDVEVPRLPPSRVVYRGVSHPEQIQLVMTPDGPELHVFGMSQPHWDPAGEGKAVSFTSELEQTRNYSGSSDMQLAEYNLTLHVSLDSIEAQMGATRDLPNWMSTGSLWPNAGMSQWAEPGVYRIGPYEPGVRGEINVNLGQKLPDRSWDIYDDDMLDSLVGQLIDLRPNLESSGLQLTDDQLGEVIDFAQDLRSVAPERRAGKWAEFSVSSDSDIANFVNATVFEGSVSSTRVEKADRLIFKPGEWRIESLYSDDYIESMERQLDRLLATNPGGVVAWGAPGDIERIESLKAQIAFAKSQSTDVMEMLSPKGEYFANVKAGLDELSDDDLMSLVLGGEVRTTNREVASIWGPEQGWTPEQMQSGEFTINIAQEESAMHGAPYITGRSYQWVASWDDGTLGAVEGPKHLAFDPIGAVIYELAQRRNMSFEDMLVELALKTDPAVYAERHPDIMARVAAFQAGGEDVGEFTRAQLAGIIERHLLPSLHPQQFGSPTMGRFLPPWEVVSQLRPQAIAGRNWGMGTLPGKPAFYNSWDEMDAAAITDLANALNDPYYAGRVGHMQGMPVADGEARLVNMGEQTGLHQNMVTAWLPRKPPGVPWQVLRDADQFPTAARLAEVAGNRNLILAQSVAVDAWIEAAANGQVGVLANRALATELGEALSTFLERRGYQGAARVGDTPFAAQAYDMARPALTSRNGVGGIQAVAGSEKRPTVWAIDSDAFNSNAVGRMRPAEQGIDEWNVELAKRMAGRARQVWTRGNKEHLVPRTRLLDDGTRQTVVQVEGINGMRHLPEGEKIVTREAFFDHNGKRIEFGDENYFERVMDNGDGEIMWRLVGPILRDGADEVHGRALFAPKSVLPEVGERVPDEKELVRAYHSKVEHAVAVGADLPNMVDSEILASYKRSRWDEFVRKGFDEVIGPSIDALARRPMAFHFFSQRYIQNKALRQWLRDPGLTGRVQSIADRLAGATALDARDVKQLAEYARTLGRFTDGSEKAAQWSDVHALSWLRGHADEGLPKMIQDAAYRVDSELRQGVLAADDARDLRFALDKLGQRDVLELRTALPDDFPADDLLAYVRSQVVKNTMTEERFFEINKAVINDHPLLSKFTDDDWETIIAAEKNWQHIVRESGETAAVAAINDMLPFIDSHEFKTQFAEYGKGFLPFWYAEENFMKRWARTLILEGPPVIRKAQLTYMGLKTAGVVRTDPNGKDWFVYPGSNLLQEAINQIPGLPDLPVGVMFQSPTDMMLPGVNSRFGSPQFGPLVTVPLDLLTVPFPELKPMERDLVGDLGASKSALDQLVPAVVANTFNAITGDDGYQRYASAQLAAIAQLQAEGKGLPDNATPGQVDEFLRTVRNHARIIVLSQAVGGWFAPGPVSQIVTGEDAKTLGAIGGLLGDGIEDPGSVLSSMYSDLVRNLGIEQGTIEYLKLAPLTDVGEMFNYATDPETGEVTYLDGQNPLAYTTAKQASVSGAPLPATEQALSFFDANANYMDEFPNAGPWLLPIDPNATTAHSQYAYDQQTINGLRRRRTPEEFLTQIKFKEASPRYFSMRTQYLAEVEKARTSNDSARVAYLNDLWKQWSSTYKAAHPIFAQTLEGSGARERRKNVIAEMRVVARDPKAPKAPHYAVLQQMIVGYDDYLTMKQELALDGSAKGRMKVEKLKAQFEGWMNEIVLTNPAVQSFWTGVLRPESELE